VERVSLSNGFLQVRPTTIVAVSRDVDEGVAGPGGVQLLAVRPPGPVASRFYVIDTVYITSDRIYVSLRDGRTVFSVTFSISAALAKAPRRARLRWTLNQRRTAIVWAKPDGAAESLELDRMLVHSTLRLGDLPHSWPFQLLVSDLRRAG